MMSKSWHADWLRLVETPQQEALLQLLETARRSRHAAATTMLCAPPEPEDETDAEARVATVIAYLTGGYRVGDRQPSMELR